MKAPPDLDSALIQEALLGKWGIYADDLVYVPVGFGDHHWQASTVAKRYFVTLRDLRLDGRSGDRCQALQLLERTFQAVRRLKGIARLEFVVAPIPNRRGELIAALGDAFALTVYDWLDVEPATDGDGTVAAMLVARLHRASRAHPVDAVLENFQIPHRAALADALANVDRPWQHGPYAEPARVQLLLHQHDVVSALQDYDALVANASRSRSCGWTPIAQPSPISSGALRPLKNSQLSLK